MQKHKNIKALFFLGIFSLLLLHQVVPHLHHQHEVEHTHNAIAHSDTHSHHHDVPEKESSKKGFLDLFLEVHMHSVVANELLITLQSSIKQLNIKKDVKASISVNHFGIYKTYNEAEKLAVYQPPNSYFNPYLSSLDTRGPPTLG